MALAAKTADAGHAHPEQIGVDCLFMRGGSSRGGFFLESDLPADPRARAALLLALYGSPDLRQIDGIGGGDPLTSKAAVIGPASHPDADLDYTFYQVGIDRAQVSTGGNCGNMLSAVGAFGVLKGLLRPTEPETAVRVHVTNIGQVVTLRQPVRDGFPRVDGDTSIPAVPGTGAGITIDFGNCAGSLSGRLLPTGAPSNIVEVAGRPVSVSFVDAATPFVFVAASDLGATGTELPVQILTDTALMEALESIRSWAAVVLGRVTRAQDARKVTPNVPRVIMVAPPQQYTTTNGAQAGPSDMDLCVRQLAMQKPHNALAVTGAVCTAVAARVPGSIVAALSASDGPYTRLGHPGGVLQVSAQVEDAGPELRVTSAMIERTARLIMAGRLYAPRSRIAALAPQVEI
ncbi:MAG: 2-methylaconitate cis-trans isomerase PrpF [Rhodobacteraceae bacterium HLUCCA12]|nr:MAG: 2-methylaconitate cis-trans isomerase PrpF [Rhodobacteraceae bacterium HLUCCA12]